MNRSYNNISIKSIHKIPTKSIRIINRYNPSDNLKLNQWVRTMHRMLLAQMEEPMDLFLISRQFKILISITIALLSIQMEAKYHKISKVKFNNQTKYSKVDILLDKPIVIMSPNLHRSRKISRSKPNRTNLKRRKVA